MSLRRRLALVSAVAVAAVVVVGSVVAYALVRASLHDQIDSSLRAEAAEIVRARAPFVARAPVREPLSGPPIAIRVIGPTGDVLGPSPQAVAGVPATEAVRAIAAGRGNAQFSDREVAGRRLRVYTASLGGMGAVQLFRSLEETDAVLANLRVGLLLIAIAGVAGAALLGRLAAGAAVRPVAELTETAEHVASTRDLSRRIAASGRDELARLAGAFNTMLEALDRSQRAQRRLVADASHELRTPLTSLRTNLEVLADGTALSDADRDRLRRDLVAQLEDLTLLVGDLVDLARDEEPAAVEAGEVRLDELVAAAVERARRHAPGVEFRCDLEPSVVEGFPARLDRAVANLLDNAAKFAGGTVEVAVRDGEVVVRDHGPGIAADDLPLVFERFYRSPAARGRPGSGLGLAIVRQVAEAHGGTVAAERAPGGGALLRMALPSVG